MTALHLVLLFMIVAALVSIAAQRLALPYTIALLIAGLAAGSLHLFPPITITPEVLLTLVIPPLLFEGALHLPPVSLRAYAVLIAFLAVAGTIAAALGIAWAVAAVLHVPPQAAVLLGVIAAAIDPVSIIALIREAGLDPRLGAILEGEAVLNDGVAIVLFTVVSAQPGASLPEATRQFIWLLGVGVLVGVVLGAAVSYAMARVTQPLVEALGSLILLVGSLIAAERLGASGVIAVICAGVVFAGYGTRRLTSAGHETVRTVWDFIAFIANSVLFLFIGLKVPGALLVRHAGLIAVVVLAALAVRALTIYAGAAVARLAGAAIPDAWRAVLAWGGLRGGVAIALVLQLDAGGPVREAVSAGVFGLVVFTLLVQGLSMPVLMRRAGLLPAT